MKLLSEEHAKVLADTKLLYPNWGSTAHTKADYLDTLIEGPEVSILDFGSGTGSLSQALPIHDITEYDPVGENSELPVGSFDFVVSIDVMEHIEPEYLDQVCLYQETVANKGIIHYINTRPAVKKLADGSNAHLIQEPVEWWTDYLDNAYSPEFEREMTDVVGGSFWVMYTRR